MKYKSYLVLSLQVMLNELSGVYLLTKLVNCVIQNHNVILKVLLTIILNIKKHSLNSSIYIYVHFVLLILLRIITVQYILYLVYRYPYIPYTCNTKCKLEKLLYSKVETKTTYLFFLIQFLEIMFFYQYGPIKSCYIILSSNFSTLINIFNMCYAPMGKRVRVSF